MGKPELRRQMLALIQSVSEPEKQRQSEAVLRQVLAHPNYKSADALSIYLSTANEIDTIPILRRALELDRKRCYVPLVAARRAPGEPRMLMTKLETMAHYERLPVNRWGIREPAADECSLAEHNLMNPCGPEARLLVLVPGVAFARDGRRLGHGRGYYDEFLNYWRRRTGSRLPTLGLALREQVVEDPCAAPDADYRLDQVLTAGASSTL